MVEVVAGDGNRRRLPSWMQGKASTPGNGIDKSDKVIKVGDELVSGNSTKLNNQSNKATLPIEKSETKRRKRKITQQDEPCDGGTASPKKSSIGPLEKQTRQRKRKAKSVGTRSVKDSKTPSRVEDDDEEEELTPEDLLSIAEEYVKDDKDVVLQELSTKECEFGRQLSTIASRKVESESSLITVDGNRKPPADDVTSDSTQSSKDDKQLINTSRTGDPAQDMLDLFLGPLLKKTVEEKRSEFVKRDLTFSYELGMGSQNGVKEETVPLTKKKCTLRDKVAMLLD